MSEELQSFKQQQIRQHQAANREGGEKEEMRVKMGREEQEGNNTLEMPQHPDVFQGKGRPLRAAPLILSSGLWAIASPCKITSDPRLPGALLCSHTELILSFGSRIAA